MDSRTKKRGFTRIALLVVVAIIAILLAVLVVAVQRRREEARRTQCIDNMKTIGIAMHNFHSTQQHFPGSGQVTSTGGGCRHRGRLELPGPSCAVHRDERYVLPISN